MATKSDPHPYNDHEATKRMEDGLRRALSTPHKPNADYIGQGKQTPTPKKSRSSATAHKAKQK
jgi:hypothetical protein